MGIFLGSYTSVQSDIKKCIKKFTKLDMNNILTRSFLSSDMLIQLSKLVMLMSNANKREL